MSDTSAFGFGQFVPGFDFLQKLSQTASQAAPAAGAIPGMANWVAPTLSVEEIDKRIQELKAVQFWLEQNGTALKATIQALEVQKMTLSTLQSMNVNMADLAKAFTARAPETAAAAPTATAKPAPAAEPPAQVAAEEAFEETPAPEAPAAKKGRRASPAPAAQAAVDPMAWWGSLTQQFQNIASAAMKDVAAEALKAQAPAASAAEPAGAAPAKTAKATQAPTRKTAARAAVGKTPGTEARKRAR